MSSKILVTGFEPFLGEKINPSAILARDLAQELGQGRNLKSQPDLLKPADEIVTFDSLVLPVSYQGASRALAEYFSANGLPKFCLMLGQAGGRKNISLEKIAINFENSEHPDSDGVIHRSHRISSVGPVAIENQLPLERWQNELSNLKYPVEISFSAGAYVCNSLYYQVLEKFPAVPSLFVHVPHLPEQMKAEFGNHPGLSLEIQKQTIQAISELVKRDWCN